VFPRGGEAVVREEEAALGRRRRAAQQSWELFVTSISLERNTALPRSFSPVAKAVGMCFHRTRILNFSSLNQLVVLPLIVSES
jgi:hypothetical protein